MVWYRQSPIPESWGQIGRYCNGVCYVHGVLAEDNEQIHGILDADGNYTPWPEADREYEFLPEFKNGYALVEFRNENGESVVTLLDKKGNALCADSGRSNPKCRSRS